MAHRDLGHCACIGGAVWASGCRCVEESPRCAAIGKPAKGDVGCLGPEGNLIEQRDAVRVEQGELLAVGVETEPCVQSGVFRVLVEPDDEIAPGRNRSVVWNAPFGGFGEVVGQVHAADVEGVVARVVDLDPVVEIALGIPHGAGVVGHELVQNDGAGNRGLREH